MATLTPTINTNTYGFDYYEVAYTCLAVQYPSTPNITFANSETYKTNVDKMLGKDAVNQESLKTIEFKDKRAYDISTSNHGIEFYTKNWDDAIILPKDINKSHSIDLRIPDEIWKIWMEDLARSETKSDLISSSLTPKTSAYNFENYCWLEPLVFDLHWIVFDGRLIVPETTYISRNGTNTLKASDITSEKIIINIKYPPFSEYFAYLTNTNEISGSMSYNGCCIPINGSNKNWVVNSSMNDLYNINIVPIDVYDDNANIMLVVPPQFFTDIHYNPSLLNKEFLISWNVTLTLDSECLLDPIITTYKSIFKGKNYIKGKGVFFNNSNEFTYNGSISRLNNLNEIKKLIRELFKNNYKCYAREFSKKEVYGDLLHIYGKLLPEYGSECSYLLKQVLRPRIVKNSIVYTENLKGFEPANIPDPISQVVEVNEIIPTQTPLPKTSLSSMFTKSNNKLCKTLPPNIKYK